MEVDQRVVDSMCQVRVNVPGNLNISRTNLDVKL